MFSCSMIKLVLIVIFAISGVFAFDTSDKFINEINSKQNQWKAGRNFPVDTALSRLHGLLGAKLLSEVERKNIPLKKHEIDDSVEIPKSFDARTNWSKCKTISQIADQSSCGSCWAVAVASAIQDRVCIHSDGKYQPQISSRNLMSCEPLQTGCHGGSPTNAWFYWKFFGLVTGGPYDSKIGCQPYPFPPCEHYANGSRPQCPKDIYKTPKCVHTCDNETINYTDDLIFGNAAYLLETNQTEIQLDIMHNGPVVAIMSAYTDFLNYKSGVYVQTTNDLAGLHAVRVIGWGEENLTSYWLVANSWNDDWGDKGLFKIRRGTNECGIEGEVAAGLPKI